MDRIVWLAGATAIGFGTWAVMSSGSERPTSATQGVADGQVIVSPIEDPTAFPMSNGSALSAAAFGMSALQPETYNGDIVTDIIKASPLAPDQKLKLQGDLRAAEAGHQNLSQVLTNVRNALAVN